MSIKPSRLSVQSILGYVSEKVMGEAGGVGVDGVCQFEKLEGRELYSADGLVHHWNFDAGRDLQDDAADYVTTAAVAVDFVGGAHGVLTHMDAGVTGLLGLNLVHLILMV